MTVLEMPRHDEFDALLDGELAERTQAIAPDGIEDRLLAALRPQTNVVMFATAARVTAPRSKASAWTAMGLHAAAILLVAFVVSRHVAVESSAMRAEAKVVYLEERKPEVLPPAKVVRAPGGGGGQHDLSAVTHGRLPKFSQVQLLAPKAPPMDEPRLPIEPTIVADATPKIADSKLPDLGVPDSTLKGFSMGTGRGTGIGPGSGAGYGPGEGMGTGGGYYHPGGGVHKPELIYEQPVEFSEEARRAKFSGNVEVYLIVDEHGVPTHVRVVRDVGMGLGEKAVEAVRQYRFKPGMLNGQPVKVDMYVEVNFTIM